ncbi:MAG: hypothetical protein RIG84_08220 [Roseovarius sp.]
MEKQAYGSVVALEFRRRPSINFADIVEEFDIAFQMVDSRTRSLTWDCDDIALIDRDSLRVALGWLPAKEDQGAWHLVIAVGLPPQARNDQIDLASINFLADRIVERTREFLPFNAVMHGEATQPVSADLIDTVFDLLRTSTSDMASDTATRRKPASKRPEAHVGHGANQFGGYHAQSGGGADPYADMVHSMSPPWMNDPETEAKAPREALYPQAPEGFPHRTGIASDFTNQMGQLLLTRAEPTKPLRLTIHTLALSLCLYVPALGAAMFAYTMLRDVFPMAANAV